MDKIICVGVKGESFVVGYTALAELRERDDPEILKGFPMVGGIESAVLMAVDWLNDKGVVPSDVRDYVDDRYGIVDDADKEGLMGRFG